jgi:putative heme-binding domain-containing protein
LGGDPARGRSLFYSTAKCSSCHRADLPEGPEIGPSLADIGLRAQRNYLLESSVSPSMKIVEKYIPEIIELEQGLIHTGIVAVEDANEVILSKANGTQVKVLKVDIAKRAHASVSLMPSMANILTTQDVADLIEFLTTLKTKPKLK